MTQISTPTKLGGQATFFLIGNIFTLIVGFPLQIYVTRVLGADGLGVFSLLEGGVGLVSGLIGFGLAPTLVKFIPGYLAEQKYDCIKALVLKGIFILLGTGLLVYGVGWIALPWIEVQWPQLQHHHWDVVLMGSAVPLGLLVFYLSQGLRGFQEIRYMVIGSSFLQLTVKAGLAILLLGLGLGLIGYIGAVIVSMLVALLWLSVGLLRKIKSLPKNEKSADICDSKPWVKYASIMYGNSLLGVSTIYLDRFLIGLFVNVSAVGVLVVIKQLQQLPVIFLQMFIAVAAPMFSAAHARNDKEERQHIFHLTTDWVVRASMPLFMFLILFSAPFLNLYGEEFVQPGLWPLWLLIGGQLVNLMCGPIGNVLNMSGMESQMLRISVVQAVLTVLGLVIFVPEYGLIGAAGVLTAGILFTNGTALYLAKKHIQLRWWDRRYLKWVMPTVAACATGMILLSLEPRPGPFGLLACLVALYIVFHGVSILQGLHDDDRELLSHLFNQLKGRAV